MGWGDYPVEYKPEVHGPYDPARFYGKADIPLGDVKLGELGGWLGRRNKGGSAIAGAVSRAFWRWQHKYLQPRKGGFAPYVQVAVGSMIFFYFMNYGRIKPHRNYKYHW